MIYSCPGTIHTYFIFYKDINMYKCIYIYVYSFIQYYVYISINIYIYVLFSNKFIIIQLFNEVLTNFKFENKFIFLQGRMKGKEVPGRWWSVSSSECPWCRESCRVSLVHSQFVQIYTRLTDIKKDIYFIHNI